MDKIFFNQQNWEYCSYNPSELLFVYHDEWHGIKSSVKKMPGNHLIISAYNYTDLKSFLNYIKKKGIKTVLLQGFSNKSSELAQSINQELGSDKVRCCAVSHVSPTQFENNPFETDMLQEIKRGIEDGSIAKAFSVKPGFSAVAPFVSPHLVVNGYPMAEQEVVQGPREDAAVLPSQNEWRKNPYPNHLALASTSIDTIFSTLPEGCIAPLFDQHKFHYMGFVENTLLRQILARCRLASYVTLIECQPMVALEATSVGTPCLTGPLYLPFLETDPLRKLTEVRCPDNVATITQRAEQLLEISRDDMANMCKTYMGQLNRLCIESYTELVNQVWKN